MHFSANVLAISHVLTIQIFYLEKVGQGHGEKKLQWQFDGKYKNL